MTPVLPCILRICCGKAIIFGPARTGDRAIEASSKPAGRHIPGRVIARILVLAVAVGVVGGCGANNSGADVAPKTTVEHSSASVDLRAGSDSQTPSIKEVAANRVDEPKTAKDADPSEEPDLEHPFPQRLAAPPLDGGIDWFNTEKPLALADLRGKFVLLDFWTYCCINCMHVLPELKKLERAYPTELVVIGVHSAKFEGEKVSNNIREAILRHEIEHPVVNDANMAIWNRYGVRSWPTMVLIDPAGEAVWLGGGEQTFEKLDRLIRHGLTYYRKKGVLETRPMKFVLERDQLAPSPLLFPGKILADEANGRLFIADSGHNRVIVASADGKLIDVIGIGTIGTADGRFDSATFNHPQGMALARDVLYIADTENHMLRKANLAAKEIATVAGTGQQARKPFDGPDDDGRKIPLNSPWALWPHKDDLYIAMAGPHQIWKMPLADSGQIAPYAGNGREDIVDGPLLPSQPYAPGFSSFAQPSGLASDGEWLYVADTEGSSIRAVPFDSEIPSDSEDSSDAEGQVRTIVGTSKLPTGRLFVFGDREGAGLLEPRVDGFSFRADPAQTTGPLLQHAIGIAYADGRLYIADTYNNKIKVIDLEKGSCQTLAGTGEPGQTDGPAREATFDEPAGLAILAGKLFVADTNNHVIRVIELDGERHVTTLDFEGLSPPE